MVSGAAIRRERLGSLHLATGRCPSRSPGMAGAAQRIREQRGVVVPQHPNRPLPEPVEPAWSEGRAMNEEEAVEHALSSQALL